ncbi:hypothetical protein FB451DRAFT_725901 [Mycena latifolia]|nr:hypothetical protein FB451DRAFT_725901 [Mycena latifolia]
MFVRKYSTELQLSDPARFFEDGRVDMFAKVFARGHTLFVGVDDYDAPIRSRSFAHLDWPLSHKSLTGPRDLERILNTYFWGPLLSEFDVIDKLFVTGILLVKYPELENVHIHSIPSLHASCGFTEQETLALARSVLAEPPDIAELRRSCGGYVFLEDDGITMSEPVLHTQQMIARISQIPLQRPDALDDSFGLLSDILGLLPAHSDVSGAVTVKSLIDLLATGAVEINGIDAGLGFDATTVTWNTLYHAGALIYDRQLAGTLRVANDAALSVIHACVDTLFADWHDLQHTFLFPWSTYSADDDPELLLELLSQVLRDLAQTSLSRKHEPNMRGILELAMRNTHTLANRGINPIILLPDDNDAARVAVPGYGGRVHVWDLDTLTLMGMWRATNPNDDAPTLEALQKLHEELVQEEEEKLLARPYQLWSPALNAMETRLVGSFLNPEPEYPQFLAVGGARVLLRQRPTLPVPSDPCL